MPTFDRLAADAKELYLRTFLELAFTYGWRSAELLRLRVRQVNLVLGTIRLNPGETKNDEGREVAIEPKSKVAELLRESLAGKKPDDFVLTREGNKPVKDFRAAWRNLCIGAGFGKWICLPCSKRGDEIAITGKTCSRCGVKITSKTRSYSGLIPHDMRRSSAKAARIAGVSESTTMDRGGWKTRAMFKRYAINSLADQRAAAALVEKARAEAARQYAQFTPSQAEIADSTETSTKAGKHANRPN
jgi:integrase